MIFAAQGDIVIIAFLYFCSVLLIFFTCQWLVFHKRFVYAMYTPTDEISPPPSPPPSQASSSEPPPEIEEKPPKKKKERMPKILIFILALAGVGINLVGIKFGKEFIKDFIESRGKKEELVVVQPQVTPQEVAPEKPKEETLQEKLERMKKEVDENPRDLSKRVQLAHLYSLAGKIALSFLEYQKVISMAPKSEEGKIAILWLDKHHYTALSEWRNTLAKKFQEPSLIVEYERLSEQLASISQQFAQPTSPTVGLTPTLQAFTPTFQTQPSPSSTPTTPLSPSSAPEITYPPFAQQYYPYIQQHLSPNVMPQQTVPPR